MQQYGFTKLEIDESLLTLGKLTVTSAAGIFPDGTLFNIEHDPEYPLAIQFSKSQQGQKLFLALSPSVKGAVDSDDDSRKGIRYRLKQADIRDSHGANNDRIHPISTGTLNIALITEGQQEDQHILIPIVQLQSIASDGAAILDSSFGVPALNVGVNTASLSELFDLTTLMQTKAKQLATNIESGAGNGAGTIVDLLMLKALNTWGAQLCVLGQQVPLHPYELFKNLTSFVAEISTYAETNRLPAAVHEYQHLTSAEILMELMASARGLVSTAFKSAAVSLPVQRQKFGISFVGLSNHLMIEGSELVLAIKADISADNIRQLVNSKLKVGSIENIKDLVNLQLPGCIKTLLPVTPRQIPYHSGMHYFRLQPDAEMKASIIRSSGVGLHVSGEVPGVELEFWTIPAVSAK